MRRMLLVFMICTLLVALSGCEKAQQASEAIDKAKTFTDDLQKKAKEIIPGFAKESSGEREGGSGDAGQKEKNEKDD